MGLSNKSERYTTQNQAPGGTGAGQYGGNPSRMNVFSRLDLYSRIFKPPKVKFNDLKASVSSRLFAQLLPFDVRTDFIRVTEGSVLTPITIQISNRDLHFENKGGVMHGVLDVFGQITTPSGRRVASFDDALGLDVPENDFQRYVERKSVYQKVVPLRPGLYKLAVVVKDEINGNMGSIELSFRVPESMKSSSPTVPSSSRT